MVKSGYKTRSISLKSFGFLYRTLFNYPDEMIGWLPQALRAGDKLIRQWKPDLIYASGMPFTALLVATHLAQKYSIPWVAEMRDPWVDDHRYPYPTWRKKWEEKLEKATLKSATALVTVSQPWADYLAKKHSKPVAVVMNGYDPEDYPISKEFKPPTPGLLQIIYTGTIYQAFQDPTPLFIALRQMENRADNIKIQFYTRYFDNALFKARENGVEHLVEGKQLIPYREAIKAQGEADILLLLLWNDPQENGVFPAKLFEYLGSRRPILAVGLGHDQTSDIIRERQAGLVSNDPNVIARQILIWKEQKQIHGFIPDLPESVHKGYSRLEQFRHLDQFLFDQLKLQEE